MASASGLSSLGEHDSFEVTVDRISCLPWHVLNIILGKLSIVDAVRTSILSKDWQYKWLSLSKLNIDSRVIGRELNNEDLRWDIVSNIINRFFLNHSSAIKEVSLKTFCSEHYSDLYQWIRYLSEQDVEIMSVEEFSNERFVIPSFFFTFKKLQFLFLKSCAIQIPSHFQRFKLLRTLFLVDISITDDDLHHLLVGSPLLVKLVLLRISGLKHLRISFPRLAALQIDIGMEDIVIGASAHLSVVSILKSSDNEKIIHWPSVIRCLSSLDALGTLVLCGDFIKVILCSVSYRTFVIYRKVLLFTLRPVW